MQKSLAKLSIFCENAKGFDLFCLFLLINQEKLRKIFAIIPLPPSLSIPYSPWRTPTTGRSLSFCSQQKQIFGSTMYLGR